MPIESLMLGMTSIHTWMVPDGKYTRTGEDKVKTIILGNTKGGVGKTTASVHLGAGFAMKGLRVLVIDADPQGHATLSLGEERASNFYNMMVQGKPFEQSVSLIPAERYAPDPSNVRGEMWLLPGNRETRSVSDLVEDPFTLLEILDDVSGSLDVVIVDTSPTPSSLHAQLYIASDMLVHPIQCEYLSLDGLGQSFESRRYADKIRKGIGLPELQLIGVLPTFYRAKTILHNDLLEAVANQYEDVLWDPISERISWAEASLARTTVFVTNTDRVAVKQAWRMVNRALMVVSA